MEHPWDKKIQVCANEVPGVINGPALRKDSFIKENSLKNLPPKNHWP